MEKKINADVIVVGGGLSGAFAAIAVKRTAPESVVWLIEKNGFLGGMSTAGYVYPFMKYWLRNASKKDYKADCSPPLPNFKRLVGGLFKEMLDRMNAEGFTEKPSFGRPFIQRFDPMMIRCTLDEMVIESGVNLLFHSIVNGADVLPSKSEQDIQDVPPIGSSLSSSINYNFIKKIDIQTKIGPIQGNASIFIDATGDADLVFHSGGEYNLGREEDGLTQPSTLNFRMGNVSLFHASRMKINKKIQVEKKKGNPLTPRDDCLMFIGIKKNEFHFNQTRVAGFDLTDPFQLSEAEIEGRRQAKRFIKFLQKRIRGFRKSTIMNMGSVIGVRETRRIVGDYELTEQDLVDGVKFSDKIALGNYPIDIHDPKGSGKTQLVHFPKDHYYSIPYRCCLPKRLTNVFVAGRPISSTHVAHSAIRIMPICSAIGHAVGTAAALLIKKKIRVNEINTRNISIKELQNVLKDQNACID